MAPENNKIYLIKTWMNEAKTYEKRELYEDILGTDVLSQKLGRKGDFRNVVIDLHLYLQYNYDFSLHNSILLPTNMKNYFLW